MPPWCLSPSHTTLGHITSHPALDEHPTEPSCAVLEGLLLARGQIWGAAEGVVRFNHPSGCYILLLIHMAPATLPGHPEYIKSGYRMLVARGMGALSQGKPCVGVSYGSRVGSMAGVTGRAGLWLFWPLRIRTAGQGWDPPKQVGPKHLTYRTANPIKRAFN